MNINRPGIFPGQKGVVMKITSFTVNRSDISKENVQNENYNYDSVVNNNTSPTSDNVITATANVLIDLYSDIKESEKKHE